MFLRIKVECKTCHVCVVTVAPWVSNQRMAMKCRGRSYRLHPIPDPPILSGPSYSPLFGWLSIFKRKPVNPHSRVLEPNEFAINWTNLIERSGQTKKEENTNR